MSNLTKRSFLNLLTSVLKSVGLLALTFFCTPILLKLIGAKDFGTFKVLTDIHSYLNLLEMGIFGSLISCLIPVIKSGNKQDLKELLAEGLRRYTTVIFLALIIGFSLFPFLRGMTSWPDSSAKDLYITFGLMVGTALFLPTLTYRAYFEASNRGHLVNIIVFIQNTSFILIGILFAYSGWNLKSQGMAFLLSGLLALIMLYSSSDIKIPLVWRKSEKFSKEISRNQKHQVLNELAGKLSMHCDNLLIAIFIGPIMVAKIFLGQRVVQIVQGQLLSLGQASWASLSVLYYEKEIHQGLFEKRLLEMTKVLATCAVATLVPVCILNQSFLELWIGKEYLMDSNTLVYVASANAFLFPLFSFWAFIFTVLGKPKEITGITWIQALINVAASLICTNLLGGIGPIVGTLFSFMFTLVLYPSLLSKHFSLSQTQIFKSILLPFIAGIGTVLIYHFSPYKFTGLTWISFMITGIFIFIVYSSFLFLLLFNKEEKNLLIRRFVKLWQNKIKKVP